MAARNKCSCIARTSLRHINNAHHDEDGPCSRLGACSVAVVPLTMMCGCSRYQFTGSWFCAVVREGRDGSGGGADGGDDGGAAL